MNIFQNRNGALLIVQIFGSFPKDFGIAWVQLLKKFKFGCLQHVYNFISLLFVEVDVCLFP